MTAVQMNPYLQFQDQAREAMDFYRSVFGGELTMMTFAEGGADPSSDDRIMHAQLVGDDEPSLRGYDEALADGGEVIEPLEQAPWGDYSGACVDRFGTSWMANIGSSPG